MVGTGVVSQGKPRRVLIRQVPTASAVARQNIDSIFAVMEGVGSLSARQAFGDSVRNQRRGVAQARSSLLGFLPSKEEIATTLSDAESVVTDLFRKAGFQIEAGAVSPADFADFLTGLLEKLGDAVDPEVKSLLSSLSSTAVGSVGQHDAGAAPTSRGDGMHDAAISM
jgi:hypothetical protein